MTPNIQLVVLTIFFSVPELIPKTAVGEDTIHYSKDREILISENCGHYAK